MTSDGLLHSVAYFVELNVTRKLHIATVRVDVV